MFCLRIIILSLILAPSALAQQTFTFSKISNKYTVQLKAEKLEFGAWCGKTTVSLFRKGSARPFQVVHLKDTHVSVDDSGQPAEAEIRDKQNGKWSTVYLDDLNFDGLEDLAIADGTNGGYTSISYSVYLFDKASKKFVYSREFTKLSQGPFIGIPEVNSKSKTLEVFWKSGAGFHEVQQYKVVKNKPLKIFERSESTMIGNGNRYITTKKLINGRWRTWTKTLKDSGSQ
jgi:hypothetical protein